MNEIEYVFYSGGFDSTSYLLECLIVKQIKVQPIVVIAPSIDGKNFRRNSFYHEEISRQNFYRKFKLKYPRLARNLLPEVTHKNTTILDKSTLDIGKRAFRSGVFSREVNQLLYFHQVCKDFNLPNAVVAYQKDDMLTDKDIEFFKNEFKFDIPLINVSKQDFLTKAQKYGYDKFLYETWSCWNPQPGNIACGECDLCKITIVETKLTFPKKLN